MGHIAIKLSCHRLENPDLDIRYELPDVIAQSMGGRIRDDGYDYQDDDVLIVYLACENPSSDVEDVLKVLARNRICDNLVLDSAIVGISNDGKTFRIVHPSQNGDEFTVSPW